MYWFLDQLIQGFDMKSTLTLIVFLFSFSVIAGSKIDGAFGFKLNQTINPQDLRKKSQTKDAGGEYAFTPSKPYRKLSRYSVFATPIKNKVYQIKAEADFKSAAQCNAELAVLEQALVSKYDGEKKGVNTVVSGFKSFRIGQSPNRIEGFCHGFMSVHTLTLNYIQDDTAKVAKREKANVINENK